MKIKYHFNTIERLIKELVGDYKITGDGEIAINSPFIKDTTYDCRISIDKQCWHDFESDEGGNLISLIATLANVDEEAAEQMLLEHALKDGNLVEHKIEKKKSLIQELKTIKLPLGSHTFNKNEQFGSISGRKQAMRFLIKKLVSAKLSKKYNLCWTDCSYIDYPNVKNKKLNLSNRIIIPSYENNKLVYYQARDFTERSEFRWKNPPKDIQPKNIILPFYDTIKAGEILFISEGPWEAIQYGGTYMIGNVLSDAQILKIKKKNPEAIYIIPDNDETARRKLVRNITYLRSYLDCPIIIVKWWIGKYSKFKDPIDASINYNELLNSEFIEADRNIELNMKMGIL